MPPVDFKLYLIGDRTVASGGSLAHVIDEAGEAGVSAVQFREKDLSPRAQLKLASEIQAVTRRHRMKLFINDRIDLCLALEAEGLHLPASGLPVAVARKILGAKRWIGVSCHCLDEVKRAEAGGADFAVLGPIYATPSKQRYGPPLGIDYFHRVRRASAIPLYAIGGIRSGRLREIFEAGADGIAVLSEIVSADHVRTKCQDLLHEIDAIAP